MWHLVSHTTGPWNPVSNLNCVRFSAWNRLSLSFSPSSWAGSGHQPWPRCHRTFPPSQWKQSQGWNQRCGSFVRLSAFCPAQWAPGKREKEDDYGTKIKEHQKEKKWGTSLVVQWLRLHPPHAGDLGSIPGQGTRSQILQLKIPVLYRRTLLLLHLIYIIVCIC